MLEEPLKAFPTGFCGLPMALAPAANARLPIKLGGGTKPACLARASCLSIAIFCMVLIWG